MKELRHFDDPLSAPWDIGNSRRHGAVHDSVDDTIKLWVQQEIVSRARAQGLGDPDIVNLLAIAEIESGFNPSAAANSHSLTSASGVFQITDSTAKDIAKRLDRSPLIGQYDITHAYERFDPRANIDFGIAYYLDRKRVAGGSMDISKIYEAWNTNPEECAKAEPRLQSAHDKWAMVKELPHHELDTLLPSRPPFRTGGPFTNPLSWTGGGNGDINCNGIPDILESKDHQPKLKHHSSSEQHLNLMMAIAYTNESKEDALGQYPQLAPMFAIRYLAENQYAGMSSTNKTKFMSHIDSIVVENILQGNIPAIEVSTKVQPDLGNNSGPSLGLS